MSHKPRLVLAHAQHLFSPHEPIVELKSAGVGNPGVEIIAPVKVVKCPETEKIHIHVETPVSKQYLGMP